MVFAYSQPRRKTGRRFDRSSCMLPACQGKLQRTKVGGRAMVRESDLQKVIDDGEKSLAPKG